MKNRGAVGEPPIVLQNHGGHEYFHLILLVLVAEVERQFFGRSEWFCVAAQIVVAGEANDAPHHPHDVFPPGHKDVWPHGMPTPRAGFLAKHGFQQALFAGWLRARAARRWLLAGGFLQGEQGIFQCWGDIAFCRR